MIHGWRISFGPPEPAVLVNQSSYVDFPVIFPFQYIVLKENVSVTKGWDSNLYEQLIFSCCMEIFKKWSTTSSPLRIFLEWCIFIPKPLSRTIHPVQNQLLAVLFKGENINNLVVPEFSLFQTIDDKQFSPTINENFVGKGIMVSFIQIFALLS